MSDKKKPGFDISQFSKPIVIATEVFPTLSLDIRAAEFSRWFVDGERNSRWTNGLSFTRALLLERGRTVDNGNEPTREQIEALTDDEIDILAQTIIDKSTNVFRSNRAKSETSEDYNKPKPCDSLYIRAQEDTEYERQQSMKMMESIRQITESPWTKIEKLMGSTYQLEKDLERIGFGSNAFSYTDKVALGLAPNTIWSSQDLRDLGSIPSLAQLANSSFMSDLGSVVQAQKVALGISGAAQQINTATKFFDEQFKMSKLFNNQFHLGIDPNVFAGIGKYPTIDMIPSNSLAKLMADLSLPTVFNSAFMAMHGLMPKGVIANVLKQNISPIDLSHATKFKIAYDGLTSTNEAELQEAILSRAIKSTHESLREQGVSPNNLEYAVFLLALLTALFTARMLFLAEISHDLQQEQTQISALGATTDDMEKVIEEIKKSASKMSMSIAQLAENDRHLRYVHNDVRLRVDPNVEAIVIQYIYPDQIVRVIETDGHWAKVEIIDYRTEKPIRGWVSRSTLRHRPQ